MSPLWFVTVSVCRRFNLLPFRFVAVLVRFNGCRRYGLSPFQLVAVSVCRLFDCRRFGLFDLDVAVMVCRRFDCTPYNIHGLLRYTTHMAYIVAYSIDSLAYRPIMINAHHSTFFPNFQLPSNIIFSGTFNRRLLSRLQHAS